MGRPRSRERQGWPDNLYFDPSRDRYRYKHPITKRFHTLDTKCERAAIEAAKRLNDQLAPAPADLVESVTAASRRARDVLEWFKTTELPRRDLADTTHRDNISVIDKAIDAFGAKTFATLDLEDVAAFLRRWDDKLRMRARVRALLIDVFKCAIAEGWIRWNPAEATRKIEHDTERHRLEYEWFIEIRDAARPWFVPCMDLDLAILARREDLAVLRWDQHIDTEQGLIHLDLEKSARKTRGERKATTRLDIEIDDNLRALLAACRDDVASPYVVHKMPEKLKPRDCWPAWRQHHTQVPKEALTREFARARDASGCCDHIAVAHRPTFHEIRSLGAARYRAAGMPEPMIQALLGHADLDTTRVYLRGWDSPRIRVKTSN